METLRFHAITSTAVHWVRHHSGQWQFFDPPTDWQETDYEAAKSGLGTFRIGPVPTDEIYLAAASTEETVLCCDNDLYMALASKTPTPKNIMKLVSRYGFLGDEPFRRINRKDARQLQKLLDCGSGLEADLPRIESVTHWLYAHHLLNFCLRHWVDLKPGKNRKAVERFLSVLNLAGATLEPELRLDDHSKSVSFDLVATSL